MNEQTQRTVRKSRLKRATIGDWVVVLIMCVLILACLLPVLTVVATSFSDASSIIRREVYFWPRGFHTYAYQDVLNDGRFMWALAWTGILTGIVIIVNLFMTILCAYPLTYDSLKGRKTLTVLIVFTMYFNAGLIPTFMLFRTLGLLNSPLVLILPGMISVFNMIIMRNFFMGIPDSLKESAEIDGAGPMKCLVSIYLPLSTPVLATIGLFVAVGRWNGFMDALFFLQGNPRYHPIQLILFNIINNIMAVDVLDPGSAQVLGWGQTVQAAAIVIAMVPILCVYPWVQRYFVQGATLGAVKG